MGSKGEGIKRWHCAYGRKISLIDYLNNPFTCMYMGGRVSRLVPLKKKRYSSSLSNRSHLSYYMTPKLASISEFIKVFPLR